MVPGATSSGEGHKLLSSHDKGTTHKRHKIGLPLAYVYESKKTLKHRGEGGRTDLSAKHKRPRDIWPHAVPAVFSALPPTPLHLSSSSCKVPCYHFSLHPLLFFQSVFPNLQLIEACLPIGWQVTHTEGSQRAFLNEGSFVLNHEKKGQLHVTLQHRKTNKRHIH